MAEIPKNHPRYTSLMTREKIAQALHDGIVHETGLIAHGRGEAFDYLMGEITIVEAEKAEKAAAAALLCAQNPVISVNGNVAALAAEDCVRLATCIPAKLEVNLFHRTQRRLEKIVQILLHPEHWSETGHDYVEIFHGNVKRYVDSVHKEFLDNKGYTELVKSTNLWEVIHGAKW